jgi:hypothetical protein
MESAEAIEDVVDMSCTDCDHPKVEIQDPIGPPGSRVRVDAAVAPLVVAMRDEGPSLACGEQTGDDEDEAVFHFAVRSDAAEFIAWLGDFGRSGNFQVYYKRDHIRVYFPSGWVDGLAVRYHRKWARWVEEARASLDTTPRERRAPHPTVTLDGIEIDADLAPLIGKLWDAGVKTTSCCQEGEPGVAWIQFPSRAEALRFVIPASTLVGSCGWIVDDGQDVGDDFDANPIGCITVEFPREDLGALTRLWQPGCGCEG